MAYQSDPTCDCLMECDNNGDDFDAKPVAHPVIRNVTLVGNNSKDNKKGIRLRAGTEVSLENALVCGKDEAIRAETTQTLTVLADGSDKAGVEMKFTNRFVGLIDGRGAVDAASDWTKGWCK